MKREIILPLIAIVSFLFIVGSIIVIKEYEVQASPLDTFERELIAAEKRQAEALEEIAQQLRTMRKECRP